MLKRRLLTSLVGIPLVVAAIWFEKPLPWFTVMVAAWGAIAAAEFYRMTPAAKVVPLTAFGLVWTVLFIIKPQFEGILTIPDLVTSAVMLPLIWLLFTHPKEGAFANWVWTIAGIFYIGWLLGYYVQLRGLDNGRDWVYLAMFTTFSSDSAAYFVGRTMGKHHMAPSISPKKTWEGAVAGILGAMVSVFILTKLLSFPLGYGQIVFLGIAVSVVGQAGDLVESLLKRNLGVKDSSNLLPGHGGFLDRIDSHIFAGVVVYYFATLMVRAG
ncbi:MAG: phosphatidate cytidylyltransferase [Chloroflexi bacterium]|nr:phosphatidate cytidylyltransferase [Chloroflexota bacterium]